jgi:LPXTG-site transpeptidase (sortase) family protein
MMTHLQPVRRGPRALTWLLVAVGLALVVGGSLAWYTQPGPSVAEEPVSPPETSEAAPPPPQAVVGTTLPMAKRAEWRPGAPERLRVPVLGMDAPVVPIAAPGGVLTPPADPQVLGWWADGARPGAERGSALVTGHTVHSGGGAMDDLELLQRGDRVWMRTDTGRIGYQVRTIDVLGKGELAERAETVFDQSVPGRLVLITCEDWNGVEYLSNVVVTASPVA